MSAIINELNLDGTWKTAAAIGINGRGKKRAGRVYVPVVGKTATVPEDVTNQVTTAPDDK